MDAPANEYQRFFPSPRDLLALPLDQVALKVLHWFVEHGEMPQRDRWTGVTWVIDVFAVAGEEAEALATKLAEAWHWLDVRGLLVLKGGSDAAQRIYFVTDRGREAASDPNALAKLAAVERASLELHPQLVQVRPQLLLGEYDVAVFVGMRSVEDRIRRLAGLPASLVGRSLAAEAFKRGGRLRFPLDDEGEADGVMHLFMGAIGAFKNPTSHRVLAFDDAALASEAALFANLLHRMLDRVETSLIERSGDGQGMLPRVEY